MKGIVLAGGSGTRLYPMTQLASKQLQPIYDKPMIYYSLSFLMLGGMKDILLITTAQDLPQFEKLLGDGSRLGIRIQYCVQEKPNGLPEAFVLGEKFIGDSDVCLLLGDNLFYGDIQFFRDALSEHQKRAKGLNARVFAYSVSDPRPYGVVEFDRKTHKVISIVEKPKEPKSNFAIPGLYIFDSSVCQAARQLKPSVRGETEIVELLLEYLKQGKLGVEMITRGVAWLDTGTPQSLLAASSFIGAIEERQGLKVACLEEVALRMGFIDISQFKEVMKSIPSSSYRLYLEKIYSEFA